MRFEGLFEGLKEGFKNEAKTKFRGTCHVCKVCDGKACRGEVPGMGGIGSGESFFNNLKALAKYKIRPRYIHGLNEPDLKVNLFGEELSHPIIVAPINGTGTNMGGGLSEYEFIKAMVYGARLRGTIGMAGDGASSEKYLIGIQAIREVEGKGIAIFKPRKDQGEIIKRIRKAEENGLLGVGIDIDGGMFKTMELKNQKVEFKSEKQLKELVKATDLPFILKGIMSEEDAKRAIDIGVSGIIVSNHGGRVLDGMEGTVDVLPEIVSIVKGRIVIMVDGGFRSGLDVLKGLSLGADFVCIGRPCAIGAYGGLEMGVASILKKYEEGLRRGMMISGVSRVGECEAGILKIKEY